MSQQIDAIYDNGVLRPLVPLLLPDQTRVKVTVEAPPSTASSTVVAEPAGESVDVSILTRQKQALEKMFREVDKLPQHRNNDGWSVRQHDELLYGGKK